jgi:hypothetical protein
MGAPQQTPTGESWYARAPDDVAHVFGVVSLAIQQWGTPARLALPTPEVRQVDHEESR